ERHDIAARSRREDFPQMQPQEPVRGERHELLAFDFVAPKAIRTRTAVPVAPRAHAIESAAGRMACAVAPVGADRDVAMDERWRDLKAGRRALGENVDRVRRPQTGAAR